MRRRRKGSIKVLRACSPSLLFFIFSCFRYLLPLFLHYPFLAFCLYLSVQKLDWDCLDVSTLERDNFSSAMLAFSLVSWYPIGKNCVQVLLCISA